MAGQLRRIWGRQVYVSSVLVLVASVFTAALVYFTGHYTVANAETTETSFNIAVVPDTQQEVLSDANPLLPGRYQWLVDNQQALNLKFINHTGDLVNWGVVDPMQFARANSATSILDASGIPYAYSIGNHDTAAVTTGGSAGPGNVHDNLRNTTAFNQNFPVSRFKNVGGTFEAGKIDNMYQTFTAGGMNWLVLTNEMWPRQTVLDWMKQVISTHLNYNVIVSTHAFVDATGALPTTGIYGDKNALVEWQQVISQYPNVKFVLSGHYGPSGSLPGYGYFEATGVNGNKVGEILTAYHSSYQNHVRLLNINTADGTIGSSIYVNNSLSGYPTGYIHDGASDFRTTGMSWVRPDGTYTSSGIVTVPSAPLSVSAVAGDSQATVSFSPPSSTGGSPVTSYTVTASPGGRTVTGSGSPLVVSGLTNGTAYTFTVQATNAVGTGPASVSTDPSVTPSAPSSELLPDPGFESGNGGWVAFSSGTLTRVTTPVRSGTKALKVNVPTSGATSLIGLTQNNVVTNSVAGKTYTASCYVQPTIANLNVQIRFLEYTQNYSSNINLGTKVINNLPLNAWTQIQISGVAAKSGERIIPQIYSTNQTSTTGSMLYDDCSVTASMPSTVPAMPTAVSAVAGNEQATVNFTAPNSDGGSQITIYTVTASPAGVTATGNSSPITVTGLTNGTAYTFTVTATNSVGTSQSSTASAPVTPATVPGTPVSLSTQAGDGEIALTWSPPTSTGGAAITDYVVKYRVVGSNIWVAFDEGVSTNTTATITGLNNGTTYEVMISAVNSIGEGYPADPVTVALVAPTATIPDAPTNVTATPGDAQATVSFSSPASDGGASITGYTVTASPGGLSVIGSSSPITITGLTNGTAYTFTVTATNSVGTSSNSVSSEQVTPFVPATVASQPQTVVAMAGNAQVTLSWSAPVSDGGAPITDYVVESSVVGSGIWVAFNDGVSADTTATVTGLTNGTSYSFRVRAVNSVGTSIPTDPSNSVTPVSPVNAPSEPTAVSAVPGNGRVTVSFAAPVSDGGAPVTSYTVTASPGGATISGSVSPITVTGLTNGTAYAFTITATNSAGTSRPSPASAPVVPYAELLTDPSFESGNGGWTAFSSGTLTRVGTPTHGGSKSLQIVRPTSGATNLVGMMHTGAITNSVAGKRYTAQCYVRPSVDGLNVRIRFLEYTQNYSSNIHFDSDEMFVSSLPANAWTLVKTTVTAQKSGEKMVPQIYSINQTTTATAMYYDDCSVFAN